MAIMGATAIGQAGDFVPQFHPIQQIQPIRIEPIEPIRIVLPPPPHPEIERQEIPDPPKCHIEE